MNILFLSAEIAPFATVGGLSQVMYFLPRALQKLDNDVRMFTAHYGMMEKTAPNKSEWNLKMLIPDLQVPVEHNGLSKESIPCAVSFYSKRKNIVQTYFLENQEFYKMRANVFGYKDDHTRWALLSKGCLEWLLTIYENKQERWWPDVIHCNDWHTAYFIELARTDERYKKMLERTPIVLTVHNFSFQGNYDFRYLQPKEKDTGEKPLESLLSEKLQRQNALLRGILYADAITTVSPSHAVEVLTPEYAEGLEDALYNVRGKLIGILNGLDVKEFNPATDPIIKEQFTIKSFVKAREENKKFLQKEFQLSVDPSKPLLAFLGRLAQQKGLDLLLEVLPHLLSEKQETQIIILGTGDDHYRQRLTHLQRAFTKQMGLHLRSDFRLPRKLFAGADIVLLPSLFEPGGIVALEALRYGAVPLVRRTGGLNDIIEDFNPNTKKGNGFSFANRDPWSLYTSLVEAIWLYHNKTLWEELVKNCLQCDFSWEYSAKEYMIWYEQVIEERKRATSLTPHPAYGASAGR